MPESTAVGAPAGAEAEQGKVSVVDTHQANDR